MSGPGIPVDDPVVAGLLAGPNLARLAYLGLDGRPRVVPIWFVNVNGEFIMITGPKAAKVAPLHANGAVALTVDSSTPPYHVLLVNGDATIEPTVGMAPEYPGIVERYLGSAGAKVYLSRMNVKQQVRIRVHPTSWRILDFVKRFPRSLR